MRAQKGFTLVEILIVVVILGILAAIVIPQFTNASTEAQTSSLCADLQTMRSQIELYKIQHTDQLPPIIYADFVKAMTGCTLKDGTLDVVAGTAGALGPYMQKIPSNPFIALPANRTKIDFSVTAPTAGTSDCGWWMHTGTGEFRANDNYKDSAGVGHSGL